MDVDEDLLDVLHDLHQSTRAKQIHGNPYLNSSLRSLLVETKAFDPKRCPNCARNDNTHPTSLGSNLCHHCGCLFGEECNFLREYDDYKVCTLRPTHQYQRITRFREVVRQYCGFSCAKLPAQILDLVKTFCYANNNRDPTDDEVRRVLRLHRLGKYTEQSARIAALCGSFLPLQISKAQVYQLERMFSQVNKAWRTVKNELNSCLGCANCCDKRRYRIALPTCGGRKNFPNYTFLLTMFCRLMQYDDIVAHLKHKNIKSSYLLSIQQEYWCALAQHLGWFYIVTVGNIATASPMANASAKCS